MIIQKQQNKLADWCYERSTHVIVNVNMMYDDEDHIITHSVICPVSLFTYTRIIDNIITVRLSVSNKN